MEYDLPVRTQSAHTAMATVAALGFPSPNRPSLDAPCWPEDLAHVEDHELSHQLAAWAGWASYAAYQAAIADVERTAVGRQVEVLKAKAYLGSSAGKVTDRRAEVKVNPEVAVADQYASEVNAVYHLVVALLNGYDMKYKAASREVTRRLEDRARLRGSG